MPLIMRSKNQEDILKFKVILYTELSFPIFKGTGNPYF